MEQIRSRGLAFTEREPERIDFDTERRMFRRAFLEVSPDYKPELADRDILNSIYAWVWKNDGSNTLKLDYNKGLFLYGPLGRGKTLTIQALRLYMNGVKSRVAAMRDDWRLGAWMKSASELANIYAAEGQPALIGYCRPEVNLVIDEFGREPNPAKYFGTEMNVMQFLLQLRYDQRRNSVTHVTTNLTLPDIASRYGDYVADRCLEMFNFIEYRGDSLRQC